jgi:hypothetical protein
MAALSDLQHRFICLSPSYENILAEAVCANMATLCNSVQNPAAGAWPKGAMVREYQFRV